MRSCSSSEASSPPRPPARRPWILNPPGRASTALPSAAAACRVQTLCHIIQLTALLTSRFRENVINPMAKSAGLLFSVLITGVLTDAIKDGVGRPRPNFYWRCFPNGVPDYNNITGQVICHGDAAVIKEGHKSFPSGHTSWSFAGLGFLSWYLAGKIRVFDQRGHIAKLYTVIMPLLLAAMVGVSRVDDYWHHWQDVFAGGILGLVVASFCYLQFFPSPSGEHGVVDKAVTPTEKIGFCVVIKGAWIQNILRSHVRGTCTITSRNQTQQR